MATPSLLEAHDRALEATGRLVAAVGPDQWNLPTPCDDWDVRVLVNHIVTGNFWAAELGGGKTIEEVGDRLDGDVLGDDPSAVWKESAVVASEVFSRPGALELPAAVSYGPVPNEVYLGHRVLDVLVHGWDLASATGQDTVLDPELVEACWIVVEPMRDELGASGAFGDGHVKAPEGADRQTELLAVLGREHPWPGPSTAPG